MSLDSKDTRCVGFLCERANSHGTHDFAGEADLQAPFRNVDEKTKRDIVENIKNVKHKLKLIKPGVFSGAPCAREARASGAP